MTWVRFEPNEPPMRLRQAANSALGGFQPGRLHFRQSRSVVFFTHRLDCAACRAAIQRFTDLKDHWLESDARVVAVVPSVDPDDAAAFEPVRIVGDPDGEIREDFAGLLEFDTRGKLLLFILDLGDTPSAAWVGNEAGDPDLHEYTFKRLEYLSIQCPE